jgi:NADPH:quinone reductase
MKAFRFYEQGGPEVLRLEDVAIGEPQRGELRIRNTAVAVNFRDVLVRRGTHAVKAFPSGIGVESAGVVEAVGPGVDDFAIGQRVVCVAGPDTAYAQARIIPAARAIVLPPAIDERTAAAMMIRGMTARYLLKETYPVKPGDTILIHAAAGGVGQIVCQWAKHLGATVIGTVGNDEKAAIARDHGCDHALVLGKDNIVERVRALTAARACRWSTIRSARPRLRIRCAVCAAAEYSRPSAKRPAIPIRCRRAGWGNLARSMSRIRAWVTIPRPARRSSKRPMICSTW